MPDHNDYTTKPASRGPPPPIPSRSKSTCVTAVYDFDGEQAGDLSFKKGDLIKVTKKTASQDDWWEGECHGRHAYAMASHGHNDHQLNAWVPTFIMFGAISTTLMVGLCICFRRSNQLIPTGMYLLRQRFTQGVPSADLEAQAEVRRGLLDDDERSGSDRGYESGAEEFGEYQHATSSHHRRSLDAVLDGEMVTPHPRRLVLARVDRPASEAS
ncbi:hypothetical protein H4R35_005846 [Dimargaris xerosporica]|nr:hypothetical protein H4R35_005846 [Dimargaris xerosporica]